MLDECEEDYTTMTTIAPHCHCNIIDFYKNSACHNFVLFVLFKSVR